MPGFARHKKLQKIDESSTNGFNLDLLYDLQFSLDAPVGLVNIKLIAKNTTSSTSFIHQSLHSFERTGATVVQLDVNENDTTGGLVTVSVSINSGVLRVRASQSTTDTINYNLQAEIDLH